MKDNPLVSIITPCYNSKKYIGKTLSSIIKQNYQNWECIVVDDGSTDNSREIINEYEDKDVRIKYIHQENSGASVARNTAIKNSNGEYIFPLDSDDIITPDYLEKAVQIIANNRDIKIVYSDIMMFGAKKGLLKLQEYSFEKLIIRNLIPVTGMYRRSDYDKTAGYDPNMFSSEDWEFWISLLKTGGKAHKIPEPLLYYRKHGSSKNKKYHNKRAWLRKYVFQKHKELYSDLFENPIQIYFEHKKFKKYYNIIRRLTFKTPIK